MATETEIQEAWNTVRPYSQIKGDFNPEKGRYELVIMKLTPTADPKNGIYCVNGEFQVTAPQEAATGPGSSLRRTIYLGSKKDPLAKDPETTLKSPGNRFLKKIAQLHKLPTNDQPDAVLCNALLGKAFSIRIEESSYTKQDGTTGTGWEFGKDSSILPVGTVPAKLDREAAKPMKVTNGSGAALPAFGGVE